MTGNVAKRGGAGGSANVPALRSCSTSINELATEATTIRNGTSSSAVSTAPMIVAVAELPSPVRRRSIWCSGYRMTARMTDHASSPMNGRVIAKLANSNAAIAVSRSTTSSVAVRAESSRSDFRFAMKTPHNARKTIA